MKTGKSVLIFLSCAVLLSGCKFEIGAAFSNNGINSNGAEDNETENNETENNETENNRAEDNETENNEAESNETESNETSITQENDEVVMEENSCISDGTEISVYEREKTQLINPSDICVFGDELIVSDQDANILYRYDLECNYLGTVGKQGMAELEFNMPMALQVYNNQLYVLDSGNYRVQILNREFEYVSEIQLEPQPYFNTGAVYRDLAIKNEACIYVCSSGENSIETRIAKVDADGQQNFEEVFNGYLCSYAGEVYAVNSLEYIVVDERTVRFQSGMNCFYRIDDVTLEHLWDFPYEYTPLDFTMENGNVVVISGSKDRIDVYSMEGEFLNQLCEVHAFYFANSGIIMASDGTIYYVDADECTLSKIISD